MEKKQGGLEGVQPVTRGTHSGGKGYRSKDTCMQHNSWWDFGFGPLVTEEVG